MKLSLIGSLLFIAILLISCSQNQNSETVFWTEESSPVHVANLVMDDLLNRNQIMRYETDFLSTIHYAEVVTAMGAIEAALYLDDQSRLNSLLNRYQSTLAEFDSLPADHVDANVAGVLPLQFYKWKGDESYLKMGLRMADIQWENPLADGLTDQSRYWVDDLYMIGILQIESYKATGEKIYLQRAARQMAAYLEELQQPSGLFHHGSEAPHFWGRGNGWVAVALAEVITILPSENEHYEIILKSYLKMMDALTMYQAENGMWRQLIDQKEAWEESSATAMFGYSVKLGVDAGLLTDQKFTESYQKAWLALTDRINENGQLPDICVGTGKSEDPQYYLDRPTVTGDLHGQAPMLWFAHALMKTES